MLYQRKNMVHLYALYLFYVYTYDLYNYPLTVQNTDFLILY